MKIKNYSTQQECIIDREDDVRQLADCLNKATNTQVHIVFAKTGYGKSFFTAKLAKENQFSDWDIIRIVPIPKNVENNVSEGNYLDLIFESMTKYFKELGHKKLYFESYIAEGHNKLI